MSEHKSPASWTTGSQEGCTSESPHPENKGKSAKTGVPQRKIARIRANLQTDTLSYARAYTYGLLKNRRNPKHSAVLASLSPTPAMAPRSNLPTLHWEEKFLRASDMTAFRYQLHGKELSEPNAANNLLVHGDNLPALHWLRRAFEGAVHCVYLDPPYNTGTTFTHYRDDQDHGAWLTMMRDRLQAIVPLLHPQALVFVQIDDREFAYLQVLMDEIFGRERRINTICVKMSELSGVKMTHAEKRLPKLKEYILVYGASDAAALYPLLTMKDDETLDRYLRYYTQVIENPQAPVEAWSIVPIRDYLPRQGIAATRENIRAFQLKERQRVVYRTNNALLQNLEFTTKTARVVSPKGIEYVWWEGKQLLFLADHIETVLGDLWTDISTINLHREGGVAFRASKKPEALLERILTLATRPGDLVLDAFAGSGTTGAVAERLGRRWILMETGAHATTHIVPRLQQLAATLERPVHFDLVTQADDGR